MVSSPICNFCAQTGMLCPSCQKKLSEGLIDSDDVELIKQLIKLEQQFPSLKDVNISKIINYADFKILMIKTPNISNLLESKGKILKILEKTINKKIRLIEKNSNYMKIVEELLNPIRILGVNKVFLPTGETIQKIVLKKPRDSKINFNIEQLEALIYNITGTQVRLSFE
ncbi:MAG: hypothetical protein OdinLCB4_004105 [Candidatus Odinarchaeum yellowstonii]|uniref:Transcription elongation factor NusA n=1 Tax=Odinarchaeota yellowstonii (strain LCB_4) TaxID=1841599 RepID=A0AAF0D112_ODILC|nr:MAG: hypothetical protein OdinLCB4_004105 [Candidatus Odinarchaeum yellowstonii]